MENPNLLQGLLSKFKDQGKPIPGFLSPASMGGLMPNPPPEQIQNPPVTNIQEQDTQGLLPEQSTEMNYKLPLADRRTWAMLESTNNPRARNKGSGATGLYQFLPSTAEDLLGKKINLFDVDTQNTLLDMSTNKMGRSLAKLGRTDIDPILLYLAHQQGVSGITEISQFKDRPIKNMKNKNRKKALMSNMTKRTLQRKNPTIGNFLEDWRTKYLSVREKLEKA
jgi:hypothetical protein